MSDQTLAAGARRRRRGGRKRRRASCGSGWATCWRAPARWRGSAVLLVASLLALLAPWVAPQDPYDLMQLDIMDNMLPPGARLGTGATAWLGTDDQGRDMLSAIIYGLRISLGVGIIVGGAASLIGATVGVLAAFFGRRVDAVIMRIVDLQLSFPSILSRWCCWPCSAGASTR